MIDIQIGDHGEILNVSAEGNTVSMATQCAVALSVIYASLRKSRPVESETFKAALQRMVANKRSGFGDADAMGNQIEGILVAVPTGKITGDIITLHSQQKQTEQEKQ